MKLSIFYQKETKRVLTASKNIVNNYTMYVLCFYGLNFWATIKTMNPINENQERKINKVFIYIVVVLSIAQVLTIIYNTF